MAKLKKPKKIDIGIKAETFEDDKALAMKGDSLLKEGQKFGQWDDVRRLETASKTHLEDDVGSGTAAVIRCFEFGINPQAFGDYQPTKQELFNSHLKGIELSLWRDGLKPITDVTPRIVVNHEKGIYQIFVGAQPARGHLLPWDVAPKTLTQIAHGTE